MDTLKQRSNSKPARVGAAIAALMIIASGCVKPPAIGDPPEAPTAIRSRVLAADGTELAILYTENRKPIRLSDVPQVLRDAVVAAEDQRFWSHEGYDMKAIVRAAISNAAARETVQGGSTITQQYVKNIYFPTKRPRTFEQKVKEAQLAYRLEQKYSKEQILEKYLNTVYFGDGAYGVESAADQYFRKSTADLGLSESALLAGLIRSPEAENPRRAPEQAIARRNHVIDRMAELRLISSLQASEARVAPLGITEPPTRPVREPHFVEYVKQWVLRNPQFGDDEAERARLLFQGGVDIRTSLDMKVQQAARNAVAEILNRPGDPEAAVVVLDPKTGKVIAMVGGRDFSTSQVNLALGKSGGGSGRQAGSAFKPFVLAAAFEDGKRPETTYLASPPVIRVSKTEVWRPKNNEGTGGGHVSLRTATTYSINGVFARLGVDIGPGRVRGMAKRMGITSDLGHRRLDGTVIAHPSISLGAEEVSALDMASAYGTLANYGIHVNPSPILRVSLSNSRSLVPTPEIRRALDPGIAWMVSDVMTSVIEAGTGTRAKLDRPVAGKTGTSQNYADAWFVGYTPQLVTAVWVGFPQGQIPMNNVHGVRVFGGTFPAMIWKLVMEKAHEGKPVLGFDLPLEDLITIQIDPATGLLAAPHCPGGIEIQILRQLAPTGVCPTPPQPASTPTSTATPTSTVEPEPSPNPEATPSPSP